MCHKNQSHLKASVSAASKSNSTDADVQPAASLADAKNNTLTVSGAILFLGWSAEGGGETKEIRGAIGMWRD